MKRILTSREMTAADQNTTEHYFVPSAVLMERAALSVVSFLLEKNPNRHPVLVLAGPGNNGGDGIAVARILKEKGIDSAIYFCGEKKKASKETLAQLKSAEAYGVRALSFPEEGKDFAFVIDALFGTGLSRPIEGEAKELISLFNELPAYRISIDIPSGISAEDGSVLGTAFRADTTITFAYAKRGHILFPGRDYTGNLIVSDIGITDQSLSSKKDGVFMLEEADLSALPKRQPNTHKGSYGKVLLIAGSYDMAGAAIFAAKAAYLLGAGLVKILTMECNRQILQSALPEALLSSYPEKWTEKQILPALSWADTILIGPGLSTSSSAKKMVELTLKNASVPMVMDADALNIIAEDVNVLLKPHTELVLTPHVKEMARLMSTSASYVKEHLIETAEDFSRTYQVICHLKDAVSVTAVPYRQTYVNGSGNHGMATAGAGDVLSGIIAGLIATGADPSLAAPLGAFIHGLSGDIMRTFKGSRSLMASDLLLGLPKVLSAAEDADRGSTV